MRSKPTKLMSLMLLSICISACGSSGSDESKTPVKPIFKAGTLNLNDYEDTGMSASDFISQDNSFSLALTGQTQGALVIYQVSKDDGQTWLETTAKQENLADGHYQFKAVVKDSTSGQELASNIIKLTVDRTAPIIQSVNIQNIDENHNGASNYSLIKGKTEANVLMIIKTEDKEIGGAPVYTDSNGNFSLEIPVRTQGESFNIQAQDIAGNISTVSTAQAPIEKGQYDDLPVSEIAGVYKLHYNFRQDALDQFVLVNDQGKMTILNDKDSTFYSKTLNRPQGCYGLPEVGTPNWKLQGRKIYKKQPEDRTYYINVDGVEYKFDHNLDYLHDDGVLARYSSGMPADINYGSMGWLLFPFAKNNMAQQSLLTQVCSQDKEQLEKPIYPQLVDARAVSGVLNSSKDAKQSYTSISEHGKINVYQYDNARQCYVRPSTSDINFDFDQKYISKDTQGFYVHQPFATTGFGNMAWVKFTLQPLNNKAALKVEGNYGSLFEPDTSGRMMQGNVSPNIYKPEFRDWVVGGNYETTMTQSQLEQKLCK